MGIDSRLLGVCAPSSPTSGGGSAVLGGCGAPNPERMAKTAPEKVPLFGVREGIRTPDLPLRSNAPFAKQY